MTHEQRPLATFRPATAPVGRSVLVLIAVVWVLAIVTWPFRDQSVEELARGIAAASLVVSSLFPVLWICVRPFSIDVHGSGLAGRTFWGPKRRVAWEEIRELQVDGSAGIDFLVIACTDPGRSLWTRPDVIDREEFQRLVAGLAPAGHVLVFAPPVLAASQAHAPDGGGWR